ncbi:pentapeptide repeat-containing protein [Streptomyces sp. NPDC005012]|uniref:pentapeptide repeat-containing protein n=1 Tax=Streptomyces sp. NPDC005012 TaxID=3154558 RepID=UPI0033BD62D4
MTTAASASSSRTSPNWPHCGHGATPAQPVGCRGVRVGDHVHCLAHLGEADRAAYLAALSPGSDIDHRGTPFTAELLDELLNALRDPATDRPRVGNALFDGASFSDVAGFGRASFAEDASFQGASFSGTAFFGWASFSGNASFQGASFSGTAFFNRASFSGVASFLETSFSHDAYFEEVSFCADARFGEAAFSRDARFSRSSVYGAAGFLQVSFARVARFDRVSFSHDAWFGDASFAHDAWFDDVSFGGDAYFDRASFSGSAGFHSVCFSGDARFDGARFEAASRLGPLVCGRRVVLDGAVLQQPVTLEMAARQVSCARTRWASTATLRLRYAELDLRDAVFEYPVLVAAGLTRFTRSEPATGWLPETELSDLEPGVRLRSVGGADVAHLALHDVDLSTCRFAGAIHLDQLKVDGWCTFTTAPPGWSRHFPWRWSRRNTLIEEHHWRTLVAPSPERAASSGWKSPPPDAPHLKPAAVAALYRQLRKSLEDGKNEPDAADFYYGECEMRRHDTTRSRGERALLGLYWALSGYGLRAARALAWLGAAMTVTVAVMMLWGLPAHDPKPTTTGRQAAAGEEIVLITDTPAPVDPTGPADERVTAERLEKSLRVVINSVLFRSSGQNLTTIGTYTEMASRLVEPVLLGLAVLAVRSRVKR